MMDRMKPALAAQGLLYPGTTRSQVDLVQRIQLRRPEAERGPGALDEAMRGIAEEVRRVQPSRIVLSSERMIHFGPGAVARQRDAIATWLPEVGEVRVLAYVREPIAYATSLAQQRLKAGTIRLGAALANPWPERMEVLLGKFIDCYGLDAVEVRHMDRARLVGGDMVTDFLAAVGMGGFPVRGPIPVLNRSLTLGGVQVADHLARLLPRGLRGGAGKQLFRQLLQQVDGPRFVLPVEVQDEVVRASRSDVDFVRRHWGLDLTPRQVEPQGTWPFSDEEAMARALAILDQVAQAVDPAEAGSDGA